MTTELYLAEPYESVNKKNCCFYVETAQMKFNSNFKVYKRDKSYWPKNQTLPTEGKKMETRLLLLGSVGQDSTRRNSYR